MAELERELNLRIRMYPEWINDRKLASLDARDRLERMARACQIVTAALEAKQQPASGTKSAAA